MLLLAQLLITFLTLAFALPVEQRSSRSGSLYGVTYTGRDSYGNCHSAAEVQAMVSRLSKNGVQSIRTYSQECNVLPNLLKATQGTGITIAAAAWLKGDPDADRQEIQTLIRNLKRAADPAAISAVLVGNECIQAGTVSAAQVASYIHQVKARVGSAFRVGSSDTPAGYSNAVLLAASDIVFVNVHPFFGGVPAKHALANVKFQLNAFRKTTSKKVVIGEVGWPSAGDAFNQAVPGLRHLSTVASDLIASGLEYYFFETHDSKWKHGGAYGVEPHWGIVDQNGKSKIPEFM